MKKFKMLGVAFVAMLAICCSAIFIGCDSNSKIPDNSAFTETEVGAAVDEMLSALFVGILGEEVWAGCENEECDGEEETCGECEWEIGLESEVAKIYNLALAAIAKGIIAANITDEQIGEIMDLIVGIMDKIEGTPKSIASVTSTVIPPSDPSALAPMAILSIFTELGEIITSTQVADFAWVMMSEANKIAKHKVVEDYIASLDDEETTDDYENIKYALGEAVKIGANDFKRAVKTIVEVGKLVMESDYVELVLEMALSFEGSDKVAVPSVEEIVDIVAAVKLLNTGVNAIVRQPEFRSLANCAKVFMKIGITLENKYALAELEAYVAKNPNDTDAKEERDELKKVKVNDVVKAYNGRIDLVVNNYNKTIAVDTAMLNAITEEMIEAVYAAVEDKDWDVVTIAIGKVLEAGLYAQGGFNAQQAKNLASDIIDLQTALDKARGDDVPTKEEIAEEKADQHAIIDLIYDDAALYKDTDLDDEVPEDSFIALMITMLIEMGPSIYSLLAA